MLRVYNTQQENKLLKITVQLTCKILQKIAWVMPEMFSLHYGCQIEVLICKSNKRTKEHQTGI